MQNCDIVCVHLTSHFLVINVSFVMSVVYVTEETGHDEWVEFNSSLYIISNQTGSWTKGREDCKNRGADLMVIDSDDEQVQSVCPCLCH